MKQFMLHGEIPVSIYKRRTSRNLRLSISAAGEVRVSIPAWAPYSAGLRFAKSRHDWIMAQCAPRTFLTQDQHVGKAHHLRFVAKTGISKPTSRIGSGEVVVSYPPEYAVTSAEVQKVAQQASIRALRSQAKQLLPQRLAKLAELHGFSYNGVKIKRLKSRWGSCDQDRIIVLNLFLMQLPWEYIDYVLLHELTHTRIMRHGPDFWGAMAEVSPDAKALRKRLHEYQPVLHGTPAVDMT